MKNPEYMDKIIYFDFFLRHLRLSVENLKKFVGLVMGHITITTIYNKHRIHKGNII